MDNRLNVVLVVLMVIFILNFGIFIMVGVEKSTPPEPLTFSHRWGICALDIRCQKCLYDEHDGLNKMLDVCWQQHEMDKHVEIFGR